MHLPSRHCTIQGMDMMTAPSGWPAAGGKRDSCMTCLICTGPELASALGTQASVFRRTALLQVLVVTGSGDCSPSQVPAAAPITL